jgi:hypothetical protein
VSSRISIAGRILEPAAGRGHLSLELRRTGLEVVSFDLRRYVNPLIDDVGIGAGTRSRRAGTIHSASIVK